MRDLFFVEKFIGSRDAIRIAEATFGWVANVFGNPSVKIFQVVIHLDKIESFFSDVDRTIDLALPITDLNQIGKEYQLLKKNDSIYRIMQLGISCLKFFADTVAACEWLGLIGVAVLSSSVRGLGYTAGIAGICVNVLSLAKKTYDNILLIYFSQDYLAIKKIESFEARDLSRDKTRNFCGITTDICLICLRVFGGFELYYGSNRVTPAKYRFLKVTASIAHAFEDYTGYF